MIFHLSWSLWDDIEDKKLACLNAHPLADWSWTGSQGSYRIPEQQRVHFSVLYLWSFAIVRVAQKNFKHKHTVSVRKDSRGTHIQGGLSRLGSMTTAVFYTATSSSLFLPNFYNGIPIPSWLRKHFFTEVLPLWGSFWTPTSGNLAIVKALTLSNLAIQLPSRGDCLALMSRKISLSQGFSDFLMAAPQVPLVNLEMCVLFCGIRTLEFSVWEGILMKHCQVCSPK